MTLQAGPIATLAAAASLVRVSGVLASREARRVARRGGIATATGLAALRSPHAAVLVREHATVTGSELDAAVRATAAAMAERWAAGTRLGVRADGGIDGVIALAAGGLAGIDVMPIGPRHADAEVARLAEQVDEVVDAWTLTVRGERARAAPAPPARRAGRVLLLSTGTTGAPAITSRGGLGMRGVLQLADADRRLRLPAGPVLVLAPPDHGHGLATVVAALLRGRRVLLGSGLRPAEQVELARRHRPMSISGVPAQLSRYLDADPAALSGVRLVVAGSSPLPDALRARLAAAGARVLDCYGSTETGTVAIEGRPLAGVRIALDGAGGVHVSAPLGGGRRAMGDRGRIVGGRLVVDGRAGAVVDSGGELVAPDRVAEALRSLPGVRAARVWPEPDDLLGTRLAAEVTVGDAALDAEALRRELARHVGRGSIPRAWTIVTARE